MDRVGISAPVACCLVAFDQNPGIRPIGIGETLRWLIGKAILCIARDDVQRTAGSLQLCAGQEAACKAGVHTMISVDTVKVHCCVLELMSRQILEQITAEESLNTRRFDPKIFISCTKLKGGMRLLYIGQL